MKFIKFILGLILTLVIAVLIRFSIHVLRDIFGYPLNLVIVFGSIFILIALILFTVHTINKNKIIKLKEEGKWEEPKKQIKASEDEEITITPKPNAKIILTIGLLALILIPGLAFFLRTL